MSQDSYLDKSDPKKMVTLQDIICNSPLMKDKAADNYRVINLDDDEDQLLD